MFIGKTATRNKSDNESYFTHRLVASVRPGSKVHQSTLLNLGRHFDLPQSNWPRLCTRIEALRASQGGILPEPETIETLGQRYGALPIAAGPEPPHGPTPSTVPPSTAPDAPSNLIFAEVDIASLQLTWPRSVGVEDAGRAAMDWLGVDRILADLGLNGVQRDAVTGLLIGRMHAPAKAGAAEANIVWLKEQGYHYLVVSRERGRKFDPERATDTLTASNETFSPQRVPSEDGAEVRLYCHSPGREAKDTAISARFVTSFEAGLEKLAAGLDKPRGQKLADIQQRMGRLKEKSRGIGQHYEIVVTPDETGQKAAAITWTKTPVEGSMLTHPGVYCLRSNETTRNAKTLWHIYTMLTDLEAVFRGLKSGLGPRPVFHHKEDRTEGPLFITLLTYQLVQAIRRKPQVAGEGTSWTRLREVLSVQRRVTATFRQRDGHTLHVRKATTAEPAPRRIYDALEIDAAPGGIRKLTI